MLFGSFVHRAGHKLEAAIEQLGVHVAGKVALDSGLSTGGFTDCLLQYGASFVYGVDVGYGQVKRISFFFLASNPCWICIGYDSFLFSFLVVL